MHKKDYVTFARMIRTQRHQTKLLTPTESENESVVINAKNIVIDDIVKNLADMFAADNPQFNRQKFMQACEIDTASK